MFSQTDLLHAILDEVRALNNLNLLLLHLYVKRRSSVHRTNTKPVLLTRAHRSAPSSIHFVCFFLRKICRQTKKKKIRQMNKDLTVWKSSTTMSAIFIDLSRNRKNQFWIFFFPFFRRIQFETFYEIQSIKTKIKWLIICTWNYEWPYIVETRKIDRFLCI